MSEDLIGSYNQAEYYIDGFENPIRIGRGHVGVDELLDRYQCESWCFITAWNPMSVELDWEENQERNQRLKAELAGFEIFEGEGRDPNGEWTPEQSFLVIGIVLDKAVALGKKYDQAAILFGEKGEAAELIVL
ncbi:MAG: DUF3293 domain-containing protein [Pyrinomonadaceae bacterium]